MVTFMRPTKDATQSDTEDFVIDFVNDFVKELTEHQRIILDMIVADASLTAKAISEKMSKKGIIHLANTTCEHQNGVLPLKRRKLCRKVRLKVGFFLGLHRNDVIPASCRDSRRSLK